MTVSKTPRDTPSQTTPANPVSAPTLLTRGTDIADLTREITRLLKKLDEPKRKSVWDIIPMFTTFLGTVVIAGISLYMTQSYQRMEAQRTHDYQEAESARVTQFNQSQTEIQHAQIRVEELKALTALTPLLASHDPQVREKAMQIMKAVRATGSVNSVLNAEASNPGSPNPGSTRSGSSSAVTSTSVTSNSIPSRSSLLDAFATALSPTAAPQERVAATRKIGEIATLRTTSPALRERAADVAAEIATSADAPAEVKLAAIEVIAKIKQIAANDARAMISSQPISRNITEVILHHTGMPGTSQYKGAQTIFNLANFLVGEKHWANVSWHYAIAPDGSIWLGAPINERAIHTPQHQANSVSVLLILDGDKELPTDAQRSALSIVLRSLFNRLKIEGSANSPNGVGFHFHRDYDVRGKTCPGTLLSKETVLGWL